MRLWFLILFCGLLLSAIPAQAGDLSIVLAGPSLVNNYPPANVVSVRGNAHPAGGSVSWGLRGSDSMTVILGTVPVPALQRVWFGSAALPAGFAPGVYNLFARDGTEEVRGVSVLLPGGNRDGGIPLEIMERIRSAALGLAAIPGVTPRDAAVWLEEVRLLSDPQPTE